MSRWRGTAANIVWGLHCAVTGFFVIAWALPWRWALWTALVGAFVMTLQWRLNDDLCVLTKLERSLRGRALVSDTTDTNFIEDVLERLSRRRPSRRGANTVTYGMLWGGAAVAAARLAFP
jgi:hypothetical protein